MHLSSPTTPKSAPARWSSSPQSPRAAPGNTIRVVVEEQRRTIYVPGDMPVDQVLNLVDTTQPQSPTRRRLKSYVERPIVVEPQSPSQDFRRPEGVRLSNSFPGTPQSTPPTPSRPRIYFYHKHDPYYGFTNFSSHPVLYQGKLYPTSEHLFQSFKFLEHRPLLAEHIRTCSDRSSVAFSEARRFQPEVRGDWMKVNISKMDEALWHKFNQHPELRDELLSTGNAELIEDSDKDSFWGVGTDRKGRNELGKALERLRDELRKS